MTDGQSTDDIEQEQDWVKYQQSEIDETKEEIGTRLEHIASTYHDGLLEGEKLQEHQNSRIEAYVEGYADALEYAAGRVERIDNLAKYAQKAEPPSDNSETGTDRSGGD
jgi:hypothetical protein